MKKLIFYLVCFALSGLSFMAHAANDSGSEGTSLVFVSSKSISTNSAEFIEAFSSSDKAYMINIASLSDQEMTNTEGQWWLIVVAGVAWCSDVQIGYTSAGGWSGSYRWNCRQYVP